MYPPPPVSPDFKPKDAIEVSLRPDSSVVERGPEKAGVGGSIPSLATTSKSGPLRHRAKNHLNPLSCDYLSPPELQGIPLTSRCFEDKTGDNSGLPERVVPKMPKRALPMCDAEVRAAMPGAKMFQMHDGQDLYLDVDISGGKWWRFNYQFDGKKRLSLWV